VTCTSSPSPCTSLASPQISLATACSWPLPANLCVCVRVCACAVCVCADRGGICGTRAGQWMQRTWHCSRGGRWWWYSISLTEVRSTIHIANLSIASLNIGHDLGVPSNLIFAVGCSRVPIFPQRRRAVGRGLPTNRSWGTPGKGESPDKPHGEVN